MADLAWLSSSEESSERFFFLEGFSALSWSRSLRNCALASKDCFIAAAMADIEDARASRPAGAGTDDGPAIGSVGSIAARIAAA